MRSSVHATFEQVDWSDQVADAALRLIRLAREEDLGDGCDWTSHHLVAPTVEGRVAVVARRPGVVAGLNVLPLVLEVFECEVQLDFATSDGQSVEPGQTLATLEGSAVQILTAERTLLNFLGRLSGVASLTRQYVDAVVGTQARVYDTRKTTPGWRLLEKYAVRCGGGCNHRLGLHKAVMLKDNHVALAAQEGLTLAAAVEHVRRRLSAEGVTVEAIEVEVDTLDQLAKVLPAAPDIVLLDNMTLEQLSDAVALREAEAPDLILEASGGVTLETIEAIARTGVDRISVGAVTHSAAVLDIGLDWRAE